MAELPEALEVVLHTDNRRAPPFHRFIAKGKLKGKPCQQGDTVVIYQVAATKPEGMVLVTDKTVLRFD